jgi:hypothetical protein
MFFGSIQRFAEGRTVRSHAKNIIVNEAIL